LRVKAATKKRESKQSQRFKAIAKELGADESGEAFERALKRIAPPKRPKEKS
jgi:hypothetical protein